MISPSSASSAAYAIFEAVHDALLIIDLEGRPVECNAASQELFGYTPVEFLSMNFTQLVHPDSQPAFAGFGDSIRSGRAFQGRGKLVRKDGSPFHADVRSQGLIHLGQPHALAIVRDISDEVLATQLLEQRAAERTRELSTLLEVTRSVVSTLDLNPLLGLILKSLKMVVEYTGAAIAVLEGDELVILDYNGPMPRASMVGVRVSLQRESGYKEVLRRRGPFLIGDMWSDDPWLERLRADNADIMAGRYEYAHAWLGVPLMIKDEVLGVLRLDHTDPNHFDDRQAQLALAFAHQAAIAIENARLYEQAGRLAALEERQKLARELHDSVSQALYGIVLGARTARALLERDPARVEDPLAYIAALAEAGLAEMRALIFELRPESLEMEGLVAALTKQVEALRARHQLSVRADLCPEPNLPLDHKEALYRVAQESLHNIVKHARAAQVAVRLAQEGKDVVMSIRDDGIGFDAGGEFPGHLGLRSMRERIERIGGELQIHSAPGQGTAIEARLNLPAD